MAPGARIDYRISLRGIPVPWTSEITVWDPPHRFVDTQIKGPYRTWVHDHRFQQVKGGTVVSDSVEYEVPGGALVHRLLVRPDLERIFSYRTEQLQRRFGVTAPDKEVRPRTA
jgi:ligand-binding SRPBCC domain-containing protein